ncbi:TRAP-type C4-dicarboxylate transport system, substrate-binding protein [Paracoccus isoporae]|uniref:TRAP-type C4-dicarboxylate transport system, substrate-binding protein n=1 Tax=Paracoccus isoporae TaxID=591205 RepID=A0A1G6ZKD4_9RHOB|nr:TRAP transporter substrate-binding protein [Paracoccus isoporae]SDE03214.1 TRAP-type C4-dicarboxylate transport system, substrate-binding protein [Paracoccus isoporae]
MNVPSTLRSAVAAAALLAWGGSPAAAQEITLKLSHFFPSTIFLHTEFIARWADELKSCTDGKVEVEFHTAGSALGNIARQYDQAKAGVVDVAFGHAGFPLGRFPRTSLIELPFVSGSAGANSKALWALSGTHLKPEYPGVHILAMMAHNPGSLHANAPLNSMQDLDGLRIRTPNGSSSAVLNFYGAEAVSLPPGDQYENLQKGTLDGVATEWTGIGAYKLNEVLKYHYDVPLYTVGFFFVMNQSRYDGLPEDVRACVDQVSGDILVATFGALWDDAGQVGYELEKADPDDVFVAATPEEIEGYKAELQPVTDQLLQAAKDLGVDNAEEILDALKAEIAKHD